MVYLFNVCDSCGLQYQLGSLDDTFCPNCGTRITISNQVQALRSGSNGDETAKLNKQLSEKEVEIRTLNVNISELQKKQKRELESMAEICKEKDYKVMSCENKVKQLEAEIVFLKKMLESKDGNIAAEKPDERTDKGIYLGYLERKNRRANPLPEKFVIRYLKLDGKFIMDGETGTSTAVYMCENKPSIYEVYPNEMIMAPEMRAKYYRLFNFSNEKGVKVMDIVPCQLRSTNTGYYSLISKGKMIFF